MNRLVAAVQGTEIYHYNAKNQLTHIQSGADTLRYRYDRQGNLLEEQGKAKRKQYSYDTANRQTGIVSAEEEGITNVGLANHTIYNSGVQWTI